MLYLNTDGSSGDVKLEQYIAEVYEETYARFKSDAFDRDLRALFEEKFELFKKKQASYGPNNIAALGAKGIFVRMWDKVQRLRNLLWFGKPNSLEDESIEDTLGDLAVYAMMAVVLHKGQWPEYIEPPLELPSDFGHKWENLEITPEKLREYIEGKVKWEGNTLTYEVQDAFHPEDPDRKYTGFQALQGEIKWPPKEEKSENSSL